MSNKLYIGLLAALASAYLVNRLGHRWGANEEEVYASLGHQKARGACERPAAA